MKMATILDWQKGLSGDAAQNSSFYPKRHDIRSEFYPLHDFDDYPYILLTTVQLCLGHSLPMID